MDIRIEKKKGIGKRHIPYLAGGSVFLLLLAWIIWGNRTPTQKVDTRLLNVAKVTYGEFNDYIRVNVPKGEREKIKAYAETQGMSVNKLLLTALEEYKTKHKTESD